MQKEKNFLGEREATHGAKSAVRQTAVIKVTPFHNPAFPHIKCVINKHQLQLLIGLHPPTCKINAHRHTSTNESTRVTH